MRIIAGRFKSRSIQAPTGATTRPTTDRVREASFSMLSSRMDLDRAVVLDLYAGSGALGIEALSRGAEHVTFVERNRGVLSVLRSNIQTFDIGGQVDVVGRDVPKFIASLDGKFDLILADPPYADSSLAQLPASLRPLLTSNGILLVEHGPEIDLATLDGVILTRKFGRTRITLFEALP